jgi:hypothetical protein
VATDNELIDANPELESSLRRGGVDTREGKKRQKDRSYKIINQTAKIPVASTHGKLWQSRRDQAKTKREQSNEGARWDEAIRYYNHDQIINRSEEVGVGTKEDANRRRASETENLVFSNTSSLVPAIYAKNPQVEMTASDPSREDQARIAERLVNRLLAMRAAPGVNIKPHARRSVVSTTLTNVAYIEVGYTKRENSSVRALDDLRVLSERLVKAKTSKEVERIEGEIEALEMSFDLLRPPGPWAKFRKPTDVLRDVHAESEDLSDDRWIMIRDYMLTAPLHAKFSVLNADKETHSSLYQPSHVIMGSKGGEGKNSAEVEIDNYTLRELQDSSTASDYGYDSDESFARACMTQVWYVWDKITRRVYLFNDKDWSWPIWVWNDPYNLEGFFPVEVLTFYTHPSEGFGIGEVTYYLDQQDALNDMNSEFREARREAKSCIAYDRNKVDPVEAERFLTRDGNRAIGIDVPEGMALKDFIESLVPPSMRYTELFDKRPILEAVGRISSVNAILQGVEFRTNTTNKAIESYHSSNQTRLDEKIDAVEEFLGGIGWKIAQMCLQFMSVEQVTELLGPDDGAKWQPMTHEELRRSFRGMRTVGGSTQKPSSLQKKQQAIQIGQVLGQFTSATPLAIVFALKMLEEAFDEFIITAEEWQMLWQSVMQAISGQGQEGAPVEGEGAPGNGIDPEQQRIIEQLPPEAKQALTRAVQQGVPLDEALQRIVQTIQPGSASVQ